MACDRNEVTMSAAIEWSHWRDRVNRGDNITLVDSVDATRLGAAAFNGSSMTPHRLDRAPAGSVLVRLATSPAGLPGERPWQAGRVRLDGVHWEESTWPRKDFLAFRDHVVRLLEAPSRLERLEWQHANTLTLIRDTRRRQGRLERTSDEYANLEFAINGFAVFADSIQKEMEALLSPSPEIASAAR